MDKKFIDTLGEILKRFLKTSTSTHSRYQGNRVNEVGRRIQETIVNGMNKPPLSTKRLGKMGYPDIEISYQDLISYLEMKYLLSKKSQDSVIFIILVGTK